MAEKKKKLNKGLDAIFGGDITSLIDDIEHNTPESSQEKIKLDEIRPNPYQPRKVFDEQALNELALSIQEHGIFQPVILKKSVQGYEIVAGERRCRAARMAHLEEVPAIIVDFSDQQMMEIALLENIQREDLNPIEEALAYKKLLTEFNLKQEEVAERVSKSRTAVTNSMRLLKLCDDVQKMVVEDKLSTGHARAILSIEDPEEQFTLAKKIYDEKMSVRDVEKYIKNMNKPVKPKKEENKSLSVIYQDVEDKLKSSLGTKVSVSSKDGNGSGKIEIEFYTHDDLDRIIEILMK